MNLNKVLIAGRLTADPQLRTTPTGQQVATFSVATNRNWTNAAGQKQEAVEFHNVVVWGRQADVASRFLNKGGLVLVEGRLQTRAWDDKQGQKRRTTEVIAERIQLGPRAMNAGMASAPRTFGAPSAAPAEQSSSMTELPTINVDEPPTSGADEIKPEDLPF